MAVSKRLRYEIMRRDNHTCRYCGATAPDVPLTVDHVTPTALGGSDTPDNLVAACQDCNSGKAATNPDAPLVADVAQDAIRWAQAMRHAADLQAVQDEADDGVEAEFDELWRRWSFGEHQVPRPVDWAASVHNLLRAGLTMHELARAIDAAMTARKVHPKNTWKYFCGVGWTRLRQRQELAASLLDEQEHEDDAPADPYRDALLRIERELPEALSTLHMNAHNRAAWAEIFDRDFNTMPGDDGQPTIVGAHWPEELRAMAASLTYVVQAWREREYAEARNDPLPACLAPSADNR